MGKKVEIPDEVYEKFDERASEKDLDSADEYVNYVLKQIYEKLQNQGEGSGKTYSEEEEEKVKRRLEGLGYLD